MSRSRRDFLRAAGGLLGAGLLADVLAAPGVAAGAMTGMPMRTTAARLAAPNVPLVNPATLARFVDALPLPARAR
ncbi:MAG: bilirubin oxidase, partial [Candidatus Saccharibacteria bacterium]